MVKAKKQSGSITLQNAVKWLKYQGIVKSDNNKEIASLMGYSEGRFSHMYSGKEEPGAKFIQMFEKTFLKPNNVNWEDFSDESPMRNLEDAKAIMDARQQAEGLANQLLLKSLHDKVDKLTALLLEMQKLNKE